MRPIKSSGMKEAIVAFDTKIDEYLTEFVQLFQEAQEAQKEHNQTKLDDIHQAMYDILMQLAPISAYLRVNAPEELNALFSAVLYKFDDRFKARTDYSELEKAAMQALGIPFVEIAKP